MMGVDRIANETQASNRSAKRSRVLLTAKIDGAGGTEDVRLRDLSRKGALIECESPPQRGSELVFSRGSTVVTARVAWQAGRRAGLEFLEPIEESEVLKHTAPAGRSNIPLPAHVKPSAEQNFKRPGVVQHSNMTTRERKLAEIWGVQVGINISNL